MSLVILNDDMDDIIKIIKELEDSVVLTDEVSETMKREIKNPRRSVSSYVIRNFRYFISSKNSNWKRSYDSIKKR